MSIPTPQPQPLTKLPSYPHMLPEDTALWNQFIHGLYDPKPLVLYDTHLGTTPEITPDTPPNIQRHILAVYPKRADAILIYPNLTLIIEIKPYAGTTAIGQALSNARLFARDHPTFPNPTPAILTDRPQPDIPWLCKQLAILLLLTPPLTPP